MENNSALFKRLELSDLEQNEFPDHDSASKFEILSLYKVKFTKMDNLLQFENLKALIISHAEISLPQRIGDLRKLERLTIVRSKLDTLPSFRELINLKWLILDSNQIGSIPQEITGLPNLYELSVTNNQITKLSIKELGKMKNLRILNIRNTPLDPDTILKLYQLVEKRDILTDIDIKETVVNHCHISKKPAPILHLKKQYNKEIQEEDVDISAVEMAYSDFGHAKRTNPQECTLWYMAAGVRERRQQRLKAKWKDYNLRVIFSLG